MAVRELEGGSSRSRPVAIKFLAEASEAKDLPTNQAETVAKYLLTTGGAEFQAIMSSLEGLGKYRHLLIAIADLSPDYKALTSTRMQIIVSSLIGGEVTLKGDPQWKSKARILLLRKASMAPAKTGPRVVEGDGVQSILCDLYKDQAGNLGVKLPANVSQASVVLQYLIAHKAGELSKAKLNAEDSRFVRRAGDQMVAAEFLSGNDLQRTILLQRVWLKLLAIDVSVENPGSAKAASALVLGLDRDCRGEPNAALQLWTAENYLLRMWLLRLDPTSATAKN
jgi:hypothetical protein